MVNNPFMPPNQPQNAGGTPAPVVQPMGQNNQGMIGATADRRKGFSDFLENTMAQPTGGKVQTQAQTAPIAQMGPPMMGGMPQMGRPPMGQSMGAPMGRPPMGGPMGQPLPPNMMARGLGSAPMPRGPQPNPQQPRRMATGGIVQGYASGGGVMRQARDASGNIVPGLFRMEYDDGTFSAAGDVRTVDALRRDALAGVAPKSTISEEQYLEQLSPMVLSNSENLSVVDVGGGNPGEKLGNDMVMMTFADGTKRQTQKALYEAAKNLGVLDSMGSGDDFANWHLNEWASKVGSDPTYSAAHDTFNTNQIAYNNTLMENDPSIAQNRMAFVQQNAPNNQAAIDAAQALVDQYSGAGSSDSVGSAGSSLPIYSGGDSGGDVNYVDNSIYSGDSVDSGDGSVIRGISRVSRFNRPETGTAEGKALFGSNYSDLLSLDRGVGRYEDGGAVPRRTEIMGQPHMLAYINPEEANLLKGLGGAGLPGPGGVPSYYTWDSSKSFTENLKGSLSEVGSAIKDTFSSFTGSSDRSTDFADKVLSGDASDFLPPTSKSDVTPSDNDDYEDFVRVYDFQTEQSNNDPYGTSTAGGVISSGGVGADVNKDNTATVYAPGFMGGVNLNLADINAVMKDLQGIDFTNLVFGTSPTPTTTTTANGRNLDADMDPFSGSTDRVTVEDLTSGDVKTYDTTGGGSVTVAPGGQTDTNIKTGVSTPETVVTPTTYDPGPTYYYDIEGGRHSTKAAKNAANSQIRARIAAEEEAARIAAEEERKRLEREEYLRVQGAREQEQPDLTNLQYVSTQNDPKDYSNVPAGYGEQLASYGEGKQTFEDLANRFGYENASDIYLNLKQEDRDRLDAVKAKAEELGLEGGQLDEQDADLFSKYGPDFLGLVDFGLGDYDWDADPLGLLTPSEEAETGQPISDADKKLASAADQEAFRAREALISSMSGSQATGADTEATKKAVMDSVKQRVSEVEGTSDEGGYDRLWDKSETGAFSGVKPTEMTVGEVLAFQKKRGDGSYAEFVKGSNPDGVISTPVGKYQVVGTTLQSLVDMGIVKLDEKFDEETQERIGSFLIEQRGLYDPDVSNEQFAENLGKEFQGIVNKGYSGDGETITTPGGTTVSTTTDTSDPANQGLGNISAAERKMNLDQYAPLVTQIEQAAKPGMLEGIMSKVVGAVIGMSPFGFIGRSFYNDLQEKSQAEREAIVQEHIDAIAAGNKPMVDKDGNYIGYTNFETDQAWKSLLPPTTQGEADARSDLNGNNVPDYEEFQNRFDKQKIAADLDPYGGTTATGFIVDEFFEADMDGDGVMEGYLPGVEYTVLSDGTVVRADSEEDTTQGLSFLGETLVNKGLMDPVPDGGTAGGSGLPDGEIKDPFVVFDPDPEPEIVFDPDPNPDTDTDTDSEDDTGYTKDEDGNIKCNNPDYVYSSAEDMCVPKEEEEEVDSTGGTLGTTTLFEDVKPTIRQLPERPSRIKLGSGSPEARSLGFANGGSVGLNAAADSFLRALQGAG